MKILNVKLIVTIFVSLLLAFACSTKKSETASSVEKLEAKTSDYLGAGTVLAGVMWEDGGFSELRYYPAKILTPASSKTKEEYQVKTVIGDFDIAKGEERWTENVISKSHPAEKNELKEGMIVLYTQKPKKEGLENARWNRGIVSSTDELYKDVVQIKFVYHLDKSDEGDRTFSVPVDQIRIIDKPKFY